MVHRHVFDFIPIRRNGHLGIPAERRMVQQDSERPSSIGLRLSFFFRVVVCHFEIDLCTRNRLAGAAGRYPTFDSIKSLLGYPMLWYHKRT